MNQHERNAILFFIRQGASLGISFLASVYLLYEGSEAVFFTMLLFLWTLWITCEVLNKVNRELGEENNGQGPRAQTF